MKSSKNRTMRKRRLNLSGSRGRGFLVPPFPHVIPAIDAAPEGMFAVGAAADVFQQDFRRRLHEAFEIFASSLDTNFLIVVNKLRREPQCGIDGDSWRRGADFEAVGVVCFRLPQNRHPSRNSLVSPCLRPNGVFRWNSVELQKPEIAVPRAYRLAFESKP